MRGSAGVKRTMRLGRVSDCRVVYELRDKELIVLVVTVAHRRDVYREP